MNKTGVNLRTTNTPLLFTLCVMWIAATLYSDGTWFETQSGY